MHMRDDETASTSPVQAPRPADDVASTQDDAKTDDQMSAELSRAAREAVRHPADPRIDRQLARMGLAPEPDAAAGGPTQDRPAGRSVRSGEVEELRGSLAGAQSSLAAAQRRVVTLIWALAIEGVVIAVLAILLVIR
jgi:phytoene dehydrogenase-like protein